MHIAAIILLLKELKVSDTELHRVIDKLSLQYGVRMPHDAVIDIVSIRVEQEHGQLYAYHATTGNFIGQAADSTALFEVIAQRMPGVRFVISQQDGAALLNNPL